MVLLKAPKGFACIVPWDWMAFVVLNRRGFLSAAKALVVIVYRGDMFTGTAFCLYKQDVFCKVIVSLKNHDARNDLKLVVLNRDIIRV